MIAWNTEDSSGSELQMAIHVNIHSLSPQNVQHLEGAPRQLGTLVMMCQHTFLDCHRCAASVGHSKDLLYVYQEWGIWEISIPSTQFCYETKTAVQSIKKKKFTRV